MCVISVTSNMSSLVSRFSGLRTVLSRCRGDKRVRSIAAVGSFVISPTRRVQHVKQ